MVGLNGYETTTQMIIFPLRKLFYALLLITAVFALLNGLLGLEHFLNDGEDMRQTYVFLDLDTEANLPTWFTTVLLFCSSLCAALIAALRRHASAPLWPYWWAVSGIFLYLSVDEATQLHESWGNIHPAIAQLDGVFHYSWVVPALALVALSALIFAKFFFSLPQRTQRLLLLASAVYLLGAIGMEMLKAYMLTVWETGEGTVTGVLVIVEESLEQIGASLFLVTFLAYLKSLTPSVKLT